MNNQKQYAIEVLEQVIKICEDYSDDKYSCYKNYRTDDLIYTEGLSDGAERCARMIEDLLEKIKNEQVD